MLKASLPTALLLFFFHSTRHVIGALELQVLGTFQSNIFDRSAAEIAAYDARTQRVFVTNAMENTIDVLDIRDPSAPTRVMQIDVPLGGPNSVAVSPVRDIIAVAVEAVTVTDPGSVYFYDTAAGNAIGNLQVGALPDMLTYTPDGNYVVVANEGEEDGGVDPEGSISVIDVSSLNFASWSVQTADFNAFDSQVAELRFKSVRIFAGKTTSQDLEPEYIAVSEDSRTAFCVLQEANAVAIVDIPTATVTDIKPLGHKNHRTAPLDPSDRDAGIAIATWPVLGMYMPDAAVAFTAADGQTYFATANEGDDRGEDDRVKDLVLDPTLFPDAANIQLDDQLGRLGVSSIDGDIDGDGDMDILFSYGARSFSIWDANVNLVYDSGDEFEQITAEASPQDFNADNDENDSFEFRSDAKGPEPEAITVGKIQHTLYAFIGLERIGGIMVYDISNPADAKYEAYANNRDFSGVAADGTAGDLGVESVVFVSRRDSPIREPLLITANEVSGTTTVFKIVVACPFICKAKYFWEDTKDFIWGFLGPFLCGIYPFSFCG